MIRIIVVVATILHQSTDPLSKMISLDASHVVGRMAMEKAFSDRKCKRVVTSGGGTHKSLFLFYYDGRGTVYQSKEEERKVRRGGGRDLAKCDLRKGARGESRSRGKMSVISFAAAVNAVLQLLKPGESGAK